MTTPFLAARSLRTFLVAVGASLVLLGGVTAATQTPAGGGSQPAWQTLFDGKTLTNWQVSKFFGPGTATVENGQIILSIGGDLSGITWAGAPLPTTNYELALQAMRVDGGDFFAGVTFPVGDSFCSLILGGWGGSMVGLSSINSMDASENETSQSIDFVSKRWYNIRIRVTPAAIETWLDEKRIINQSLPGNRVDTRIEVDASQPLGVASWRTKAAFRDVRLRRL